jgi:Ca-activated chloride channel family protein
MEFLSPGWLYLSALAIPVIAFYLFRPKRRELKVPTTIFWRQILRERSERPAIKRLRQLLSLLLLLLFLAALVMAAAKPFLGKNSTGRDIIIVIDTSASMGVQESGGTRLDLAKEKATDILNSLPAGAQAALLSLGPSPSIVVSKTQDVPLLLRGLQSLKTTSGSSNFQPALELAEDIALGQKPPASIYLLSDGGGLPETEGKNISVPVTFVPIGEAQSNVGVTHFVVRQHPTIDKDYEVLLTVHNDSAEAVQIKVELYLQGALLNALPMTIESKGDRTEVFSQTFSSGGIFEARVVKVDSKTKDLLPDDDSAFAYIPERPKAQIALVSASGNYFLKAALLSNPSIDAYEIAADEWAGVTETEYDVVIFHRNIPEKLPSIPYFIFDSEPGPGEPMGPASGPTSGPTSLSGTPSGTLEGDQHGPVTVTGEDAAPAIGVIDYRHPLIDRVGLEKIHMAEARIVARPTWGKVVVDGLRGPWIIAGEKDGVRAIYCAFDPNDSDLPFRVGFLNLIANGINWLRGPGSLPADFSVAPGSGAPIAVIPKGATDVTIRRTDIENQPEIALSKFRARYPGVYEVKAGGEVVGQFVSSLLDPKESRIALVGALGLGEKPYQNVAGALASLSRDLWWPIAALGLLFVLVEWFLYRRKIVQ